MNKREQILEIFPDEDIMFADGLDDAIVGTTYDKIHGITKLVYSKKKCLDIFINDDGMEEDVAIEHLEFNTCDAYVGIRTPVWVDDIDLD